MKKEFSLIGLGISAWLTIISIAYTIRILLVDFFIIYNVRFTYIHFSYELICNCLIVLGFYVLLKYLRDKKDLNYLKMIRNLIVFFVIIQILQLIYTLEVGDFIIENYHDKWTSFYDYERDLYMNAFANSLSEIIRYIATGVLFFTFYRNEN